MNELGILLTLFWFTCIGAVSCAGADEDPKPQPQEQYFYVCAALYNYNTGSFCAFWPMYCISVTVVLVVS